MILTNFETLKDPIFSISKSSDLLRAHWHVNKEGIKVKIPIVVYLKDGKSFNSYFSFILNTMPSGCGSVLMSNCTFDYSEKFRNYTIIVDFEKTKFEFEIINEVFELFYTNGVGCIFTTYGQTYYDDFTFKFLIRVLDFEIVSEYNNWRHGPNYTQRLLTKKILKP